MHLKPINDHIIVKAMADERAAKAGIVLPETVEKEKPEQGEVIAVGPGKLTEAGQRTPLSVKAGDVVLFKKYAPDEIKVDDVEYLVLSENDILAVVEK
jgi:chaperonin GroES